MPNIKLVKLIERFIYYLIYSLIMAKTITVSDDTWQKLTNLKVRFMDKTIDLTINRIIKQVIQK